jgi:hypothetical protein
MTTFSSLKKSSANIDRLIKEMEKVNSGSSEKQVDDRFWQPEVDKAGNGVAIIRFLPGPAVDGDDALPWVRVWSHGFKGPTGKWYIENSLTTLNQKDPVTEYNSELWAQSDSDESWQRKQVRAQKRKLTYISNIYVISDPKNPENEGKVFLYRYGKKIFDKISLLMNPELEAEKPINPFDFWSGCNFKLSIRNVQGYRNYDQSTFYGASPLKDNDDEMEAIWKKQYSLKEFVDPANFKSYDELKRRLHDVLELDREVSAKPVSKPVMEDTAAKKPAFNNKNKTVEDTPPFDMDADDDDLSQFRNLLD